jgi:nitrite reductase/ring-hydroxylating ferredoxin subunit/multimeric flavodoxin WrbA
MATEDWVPLGSAEELERRELQQVTARQVPIALCYRNRQFTALSGVCNHVGGPLGEGRIEGDYVTCPWHFWMFHWQTGKTRPEVGDGSVPTYRVKVEQGTVYVDLASATPRKHIPHAPHPLARKVERQPGPIRVVGISTTMMNLEHPRPSTSELLLETALNHAAAGGCETQNIRLRELGFRHCEGFYSRSAHACTWPCSITQMDPTDQLDRVYEAFVHWADAIIIATSIRWGAPASLYQKMVERMNCIQNQETIADRHLLKNKSAAFIITGGQDNIQAVAGQMLGFFAEVGCQFPQFPYIAHSRGWSAEDMENNIRYVEQSHDLQEGARGLAERTVAMAKLLVQGALGEVALVPGGRKGNQLDVKAQLERRGQSINVP